MCKESLYARLDQVMDFIPDDLPEQKLEMGTVTYQMTDRTTCPTGYGCGCGGVSTKVISRDLTFNPPLTAMRVYRPASRRTNKSRWLPLEKSVDHRESIVS